MFGLLLFCILLISAPIKGRTFVHGPCSKCRLVTHRPKDMVTIAHTNKTASNAQPHVQSQFMLRQSGNTPRYSLLLMSEITTRSDGWTSCSLYCLKPSSSPPAVALCLQLEGEAVMINALSAGISAKEPGVPAEVLCPYCGDSVTQYLQCGATLKNNCKNWKSRRSCILPCGAAVLRKID